MTCFNVQCFFLFDLLHRSCCSEDWAISSRGFREGLTLWSADKLKLFKSSFFSWTKETECCALLLRPLGLSFYLGEFQKVNNPGCKWCSNKPTRSKIDGTPTKRVRRTSSESNRLCCSFWAKQWDLFCKGV